MNLLWNMVPPTPCVLSRTVLDFLQRPSSFMPMMNTYGAVFEVDGHRLSHNVFSGGSYSIKEGHILVVVATS